MKAALLGTYHPSITETERQILLTAVKKALQRQAGYIPKHIAETPPLPSMTENLALSAAAMMSAICEADISDCNPRAPYLFLAWLLAGSDHLYWLRTRYRTDKRLMYHVAEQLILTAVGDGSTSDKLTRADARLLNNDSPARAAAVWASRAVIHAAKGTQELAAHAARQATREPLKMMFTWSRRDSAWVALQKRAMTWCGLDDLSAGRIAQTLMLDIFEKYWLI